MGTTGLKQMLISETARITMDIIISSMSSISRTSIVTKIMY